MLFGLVPREDKEGRLEIEVKGFEPPVTVGLAQFGHQGEDQADALAVGSGWVVEDNEEVHVASLAEGVPGGRTEESRGDEGRLMPPPEHARRPGRSQGRALWRFSSVLGFIPFLL